MRSTLVVLTTLCVSYSAFAQVNLKIPTYTGCADKKGRIYSVAIGDKPLSICDAGDLQLALSSGDITAINVGKGLVGGATEGIANITLDLPSCTQGQVVVWVGSKWGCVSIPDPGVQGHRMWIGVVWEASPPSEGFVTYADIEVLNPGNRSNRIAATFFALNGTLLLDPSSSQTAAPGEIKVWRPRDGWGWLLVSAEYPVVPFGQILSSSLIGGGGNGAVMSATNRNVDWHPLDCTTNPEGFEFICNFGGKVALPEVSVTLPQPLRHMIQ